MANNGFLQFLAGLLGGGLNGYQGTQQRMRQDDATKYQRDQAEQARQEREDDQNYTRQAQLAQFVPPEQRGAYLKGLLPAGVAPPAGVDFGYDPNTAAANQTIGQGLLKESFTRQHPAPVLDVARAYLSGKAPPNQLQLSPNVPPPASSLGDAVGQAAAPATPAPMAGLFRAATVDPVSAAFKDNPGLSEVLQKQRDDAAAKKALDDRTSREKIASGRADSAAKVAGIKAGTAEGNAYRSTYARIYAEDFGMYGDAGHAHLAAHQAALGSMERANTLSANPIPDFAAQLGALPSPDARLTPKMITANAATARVDAMKEIAEKRIKSTEGIAARRLTLDSRRADLEDAYRTGMLETQKGRLALDGYKTDLLAEAKAFDERLRVWTEQGKLAPALKEHLTGLRQKSLALQNQINGLQAQQAPNWPLINRMSQGLQSYLDEEKSLIGNPTDRGAAPAPFAPRSAPQPVYSAPNTRPAPLSPAAAPAAPAGGGFPDATRGIRQKSYQVFVKQYGRDPSPAELKRIQGKIDRGQVDETELDRILHGGN